MRFKQLGLSILLLFAFCLSIAPAYASNTVPNGTTVYITDSGTKYHREGCTYLKSSTAVSLRTAINRGYEPCSRCRPDIYTGRYESDWDGQSGSSSGSAPAPSPKPSSPPSNSKGSKNSRFRIPGFFLLSAAASSVFYLFQSAHKRSERQNLRKEEVRALEKDRQERIDTWLQEDAKRLINEHRQHSFEANQIKYTRLYDGKPPEQLVEMPLWVEIGPDGLPKDRRLIGWGECFTYFKTRSGKCIHKRAHCCGATIPVHAWLAIGIPLCSKCCTEQLPDMNWYKEYLKIKQIKQTYNID